MKSRFFKNLAKGLVVVSAALAVVNCDESTVAAAQQQYDPNDPLAALSSSGMADPAIGGEGVVDPTLASSSSTEMLGGGEVDPWADPCVASSLPDACGPGTNPVANPTSSADVNPASSADVTPASSETVIPVSSETVKPQSSSSEAAPVVSSSSEEVKPAGIFLATDTDENKNYMEVEYIRNTADNGGGVLCYPKRLSNDQKHGVILWGPGGGSSPNDYEGIIRRLASHGFVVVATSESPDGTNRGIPALNWLENKNNNPSDPLYQKLDMTKVGASGHSMGGLQSEKMLINDKRVITAVLNNSGAFNHAELTNVPQGKTAAIVYGEGGMERPNAEGDYNNNNVRIPACLLKMTGGQGNECYNGECGWGHGSGPWGGMAATVAWMRWHLGGEDWRKDDFVGTSGKYIDGAIVGQPGKWKGQCKNF
ncbi:MAG: alpha/beta hydrolase [Fibrobacter sp.]|uniref:poly(ethylene terephthalate) hydrolase family protein n=1 Tax=Fibrobacter sp. TaxID=35828 RepID=UPI0025C1DB29|nr:alpha/beta hydrolase [Fibrobacter sp.]MBQ9226574.1 alpha/beta hydrolase [Fibrobacter sp.]